MPGERVLLDKGDLVWLDFEPLADHEQSGIVRDGLREDGDLRRLRVAFAQRVRYAPPP